MKKWTGAPARAGAAVRAVAAVAVAVAAVLALTGCDNPDALHDAGPARQVAEHPSPQPLWPAAATSAPAPSRAESDAPPPSPLPGLAAPAGGLAQLDARSVLLHDPALTDLEHRALSGDCTGCAVQPAQYRDLSGDGRPELITAVLTAQADGRAVLHVYGERDGKVVPVLAVAANAAFTADTVGRDLVLHEPDGPTARTSSTYRWNAVRMAFVDRQTVYTGPADGAAGCPTPEPSVPAPRPTRPGGAVIAPDGRSVARSATPSPAPTSPTRQR
ncbi:hypothetical protein [Kitasatospora paranensis]|uniref:Lipoprotein n=1 Tax=Kitasatospora paranensis TaxID=258053 RepID=A0ABW2FR18_9ACTN